MRARANVLGKGASLSTEYLIPWFELRYILTDRFQRSRKVNTHSGVLWFAQADSHQTYDLWRAFDEVPVVGIDRSRTNSDQDLIVIGNRLFNVLKLQMGQAVVTV